MTKQFTVHQVARFWRRNGFNINRTARVLNVSRQTVSAYLQDYFSEIKADKIHIDLRRHVVLIPLRYWNDCSAKLFGKD